MALLNGLRLAALIVMLSGTAAAPGAVSLQDRREAREPAHIDLLVAGLEMLHATVEARMPGLLQEMPTPGTDDLASLVCDPGHRAQTHALLIGINRFSYVPSANIRGAENDARLLASTLENLGVAAGRVHLLIGEQAHRTAIADRVRDVADAVGCGDRVVLHLSGMGWRYEPSTREPRNSRAMFLPFRFDHAVFNPDGVAEARLAEGWAELAWRIQHERLLDPNPDPSDWLALWAELYDHVVRADDPRTRHLFSQRELIEALGLRAALEARSVPEAQISLLHRWLDWRGASGDDFVFWMHLPEAHGATEVILGQEIARMAALLRARGAHVVIVTDTKDSGYGDLFARSGLGQDSRYAFHYRPDPARDFQVRLADRLPDGAGSVVVAEAAVVHESVEMNLPRDVEFDDRVVHGWFSFHLAQTLLRHPLADAGHLAEAIAEVSRAENRTRPDFRITATDPHLVLIPEAAPETRDAEAIRVISPDLTRGASRIEQPRIDLVAAVDWPARILGVWADDVPVEVASDGTFSRDLRLQTGLNRVVLTALTGDSRLHRRVVEFAFDGDREALVGQGRRYALLIANQRYGANTGFANLQTPIGDAHAVGDLLRERFGFVTEADHDGTTVPLLLEDPTQRQILRTLNTLAMVASPADTVLIFYAGHGVSDDTLGLAAWAPADTELGFPDSLLHSATLENALRRFRAGNLILISDSCYAGALFRSDAAADAASEDLARIDWLLRAQARTSRVLITSGSDQPVLDGGGDGHSVFARALLTGLAEMPEDAFTAAELFQRFLLHPVAGRTAQEPQYRSLRELGHVGGDVVFVASAR